ncbi:guanine deaminase [Russula earlei]|uniref:Guanine deaminase n=1 Tax=Russula earlei TaxID=71964 RepID=A0ACC0UCV7_9AGAM|nr:guanine deaminase [Russula earlei]
MSQSETGTIFYGPIVNPKSLSSFQTLPRCLVAVGPSGEIDWIEEDVPKRALQDILAQHRSLDVPLLTLKHGEFLLPGFVDTHTHAPQVPNIGSGQQYELLDWLHEVTFPMEARFGDVDFARRAYSLIVKRIIDSGTTTCCYYGTLHLEATTILAEIVNGYGQRAFVGKCNMDRNSPEHYVEPSVSESIDATLCLISRIRSLPQPRLVEPVLTPRFAISCTSDLMYQLGDIARADPSLRIQTHMSENLGEVRKTLDLFPTASSYADVYDKHGLLGQRTILAHAIHLEQDEVVLVKERGAGVSHCPASNFNLRSGVCPVGKLLDHGIKVGLGSDVSGGFSPSILTAIQQASIASKVLAMQAPIASSGPTRYAGHHLPLATLLHLATLGGAQVCGLENRIGSFAPGKAFDALLVSVRGDAANPGLWGVDLVKELHAEPADKEQLDTWLERFLFTGDDRNIKRVYVQGRWIGGAEHDPCGPGRSSLVTDVVQSMLYDM